MGPVEPAYRIEALYTRHVDPQRTDRKIANSLRVEKGRNSVASETTTHPLATNRARKTKRKIQSNTIQPLDRSQVRGRTGTDELANTEHRAMWITRRSPTRHSLRVESFGQRENKTVQRQQEIKAPIDATLCHLQRPTDPSCKTQQPKRANHRLPANYYHITHSRTPRNLDNRRKWPYKPGVSNTSFLYLLAARLDLRLRLQVIDFCDVQNQGPSPHLRVSLGNVMASYVGVLSITLDCRSRL